jgi:hypothetical protein
VNGRAIVSPARVMGPPVGLAACSSDGWTCSNVLPEDRRLASAVTFRLVENPVRNSRVVKSRTKLSLAIGVVLILLSLAVAQCQIASHFGSWNPLLENGF